MKHMKRLGLAVLLLALIILPIISAQQVVQVQQDEPDSIWGNPMAILKSQIFWGGAVIFAIIIAFLVGVFFLFRWLVKYIKSRSDVFWRLKEERTKLAKIHRRYPSKSWLKVEKNTPIRLVRQEGEKIIITKPIGYHRGDYVTHEGNVIISLNLENNKKWFFLPITDLLIIPNKEMMELNTKDSKGVKNIVKIDKLPNPKDIVKFHENEILIFAEGFSNTGMFLIPVVKDKEGQTIDLSMPVFDSLKKVVLGEYLYEQTDEFSKLAKKSMDINPNLRYAMKTQDASQSVDVPSGQN